MPQPTGTKIVVRVRPHMGQIPGWASFLLLIVLALTLGPQDPAFSAIIGILFGAGWLFFVWMFRFTMVKSEKELIEAIANEASGG